MKILSLIIVILTGILLIYGTLDMPDWADPESYASRHVSPKYITEANKKTHTPNIVTAILADYRSFDTLGETTVIFCAGMACVLILRQTRRKKKHG